MPNTTSKQVERPLTDQLSFDDFREIVLKDYRLALESRQVSLLGRKEVLTGKAKFGVFGDGKELAQLAMARQFKPGDWRSGYYRDQTFMFATGIIDVYQFFSQLYAHPDIEADPASAGRQMNCHFATRMLTSDGKWSDQTMAQNVFSDISTTGGQMPRLIGLGLASKLYRENPSLKDFSNFSNNGDEIAFGTIGNASTSEGVFFEALNAAGVRQIPILLSVWDDGYGISVPNSVQTTKEDISEILKGFQRDENGKGFEIFKVKGWDYPGLCEVYEQAAKICREEHVPVLVHVTEMTQPQGHSTSGSHERYKSKDRLAWEDEFDSIAQMRRWMLETGIASEAQLSEMEEEVRKQVRNEQKRAWLDYNKTLKADVEEAIGMLEPFEESVVQDLLQGLRQLNEPSLKETYSTIRQVLRELRGKESQDKDRLKNWYREKQSINADRYNSHLFTGTAEAPLNVEIIPAQYDENSKLVDGREVLNACFDANFERDGRLIAFGEDVGMIGDVNQGFAGLQAKYGEMRIFDTGIRESTIIGQGIGLAVRGFRPIAEIQYLDYLLYALPVLSDDLASLSYRTKGGQKAPLIVRTRGHRLEGIWHSGSPMSMILGSMRGIHICVPRNMTQAAGMYNTLLRSDEPALVIECLNGYRLKERQPENVGEFTVPLGQAELIKEGIDLTVVSYGSTLRIVEEAVPELEKLGISIEIIDPQTLLPFDETGLCLQSLQKTNRLLVVDEDVPGGASAFILQQIMEVQQGYYHLDGQPRTLTAKAHRPPYGSDGDYFSKPSVDDVIEAVYAIMHEADPSRFPALF
ncbi:MAG TPA: thiamine pyrophosphate-dependent enzyme [Sphingobacteriaceae bacterium]|nr:thiamine pyrophosphate-dependent enzyme [Sphingobacteriaceae bacterium]